MSSASTGPFSQTNRIRLIDELLGDRVIDPGTAWKDVYRLLLWVDARTGIAHCYESDKSQPGKPWYPRSLRFHDWVSQQLGKDPLDLKSEIDFMFQKVIPAVVEAEAAHEANLATAKQRELFPDGRNLPMPGDDPRLEAILETVAAAEVSQEQIVETVRRIYAHLGSGNKRANLLGRGFEDVLAGVIARLPTQPAVWSTQMPLDQIPGFRPPKEGEKVEKVDLWVGDGKRRRMLVSAKWSVRSDRESQFTKELGLYLDADEWRDPFEYVWVTNEFDAARLVKNATDREGNRRMFDQVVHIAPEALKVVHALHAPVGKSPKALRELLDAGRIVGLDGWLRTLPSL